MPIYYDDDAGVLAIGSEYCGDCGAALYDTGCAAPACRGYVCYGCGTGCDIEADPEHGRCATALAAESAEDHDARIDAERAAFGLPALPQEHREG